MAKETLLALYAGIKKVNLVCATIAGLLILFVTFSIFLDVFFRYFFRSPSIWITETSTYLFLYIIFLATAYALQEGQHIRVTFLRYHLSAGATRVLNLICSLLAMLFSAVLLWQVSSMTWTAFREQWTSPTVLNAPLAYVYLSMVVGMALLLATFALITILEYLGIRPDRQEEEGA